MNSSSSWSVDPDVDTLDLSTLTFNDYKPLKKVTHGDIFSAVRAGDLDNLHLHFSNPLINVNARDKWYFITLYYAFLDGLLDAARMVLEAGAIFSERTFDGDGCYYAALNLNIRNLLKMFEAWLPRLGRLKGH